MSSNVSAFGVRRRRTARARESVGHLPRWVAVAVLLLAATAGAVTVPQRAFARSVVIPERVGSFVRVEGERWGYLYSNTKGVGAAIGRGARADTRKVTRTVEYGVSANKAGLKLDVIAEHTVRYEVFVNGTKRGQIYRVYQPKVTIRSASGRLFYLWKLAVSMKSTVLSLTETLGGGQTYRVKHQITLTLPRQALMPRSRWIELARQLAEAKSGPYVRTVTVLPDGAWGRLVVGFE